MIETNLIGTFHTARATVGHMLRQRWGRVINIVSPSGLIATPGQTAYSASKAGVIGLTRTLAAECGRRGVTVNALSPGFMVTGMTRDLPDHVMTGMKEKSPIPRFGSTEEVARAVRLYLDSDFMTGQDLSASTAGSPSPEVPVDAEKERPVPRLRRPPEPPTNPGESRSASHRSV